ncbi:MAG: hypothetical protein AAGF12_39875 [Myxococcota bacterium]
MTEATAGRCCWPNQVWSEQAGRCSGPPACPAGLVGNGDQCVSEVPTAPSGAYSPSGQAITPQPYAEIPAEVYVPQPAPPRRRSGPRRGLVIGGASMFAGGYLSSVLIGAIAVDLSARSEWNLMFVPVVGAAICAGECIESGDGSTTGRLLFVLDSVLQLAGVTMFVLGFALGTSDDGHASRNELEFAVSPWVNPEGGGLTLVGRNF